MKKEEKFYHLTCTKEIAKYRKQVPNNKLGDPIRPADNSIVFCGKNPENLDGEEILIKMKNPLCKAILDREVKLISTYIDKMVAIVNPKIRSIA